MIRSNNISLSRQIWLDIDLLCWNLHLLILIDLDLSILHLLLILGDLKLVVRALEFNLPYMIWLKVIIIGVSLLNLIDLVGREAICENILRHCRVTPGPSSWDHM